MSGQQYQQQNGLVVSSNGHTVEKIFDDKLSKITAAYNTQTEDKFSNCVIVLNEIFQYFKNNEQEAIEQFMLLLELQDKNCQAYYKEALYFLNKTKQLISSNRNKNTHVMASVELYCKVFPVMQDKNTNAALNHIFQTTPAQLWDDTRDKFFHESDTHSSVGSTLAKAFETVLFAVRNIEAEPLDVLFALKNFSEKMQQAYSQYQENDELETVLKNQIIKVLMQEVAKIHLAAKGKETLSKLVNGISQYYTFCFNKKNSDPAYKQHFEAYEKNLESMRLLSTFPQVLTPIAYELIDGFTEVDIDDYDTVFNYVNISNSKTKYQDEETFINWSFDLMHNICFYFIRYGVKENSFHNQHAMAEKSLLIIKQQLLMLDMPVIDKYRNIINVLKEIPVDKGLLFNLVNQSLKDVADLMPIIERPNSLTYQALKANTVCSIATSSDIEKRIQRTTYNVVIQERENFIQSILPKQSLEKVYSSSSKKAGVSSSRTEAITKLPIQDYMRLLQVHTGKTKRFLRWVKQFLWLTNSVTKQLENNGFRRGGKFNLSKIKAPLIGTKAKKVKQYCKKKLSLSAPAA